MKSICEGSVRGMANNVEFKDFSFEIKGEIAEMLNAALEECAAELESQVKQNSRVDTGQTKSSFQHHVDDENHVATIGSPEENAVWEEFGTGEYALHGDGRKGGWSYQDQFGEWHHTNGKKPSRAFQHAYDSLKNPIKNRLQNAFKGV